jgi:hypothetical protein
MVDPLYVDGRSKLVDIQIILRGFILAEPAGSGFERGGSHVVEA